MKQTYSVESPPLTDFTERHAHVQLRFSAPLDADPRLRCRGNMVLALSRPQNQVPAHIPATHFP